MTGPARRVVITGAASGIGAAVAAATITRGDEVFLLDVDATGLAARCTELGARGSAVLDVSDSDSVDRAVDASTGELGGIDLVVHAAGVTSSRAALRASTADHRWILDVNVLGTILVATAFARVMVTQSTPSWLVLVGSEHSLGVPHLGTATYTASKHAVLGFADVLRRELPEHVGLSVFCPGLVATDLWRSTERRGDSYGGAAPADTRAAAVMDAGLPAAEAAQAVLQGVQDEAFLIFTHGHVGRYAQERYQMITDALAASGLDVADDRYEVTTVVQRLSS